jgi:hypothetical protein
MTISGISHNNYRGPARVGMKLMTAKILSLNKNRISRKTDI